MWLNTVSNESYQNDYRSFLSSSDIRRLLRSPAHYKNPAKVESAAMAFGTVVHTFVLEPHVAEARYRPRADVDGRTKEGKAVRDWEQSLASQQGVQFVSRADYDAAISIATSVRTHMGASSLIAGGVAETAGIVSDFLGVNCRIKPDYRTDSYIVDLKTCYDARPEQFCKSALAYQYQVQAALYVDVAEAIDGKKRDFYWVAVEKDAPYAVAVYKASEEMLEHGRRLYQGAIKLYKDCAGVDMWPAYSELPLILELPGWVK